MNLQIVIPSLSYAPRLSIDLPQYALYLPGALLGMILFMGSLPESLATPTTHTSSSPLNPTSTPKSYDPSLRIARSGEVTWTLQDAEIYLKRYRAWLHWETSAPQPLEVLEEHILVDGSTVHR